jgi:predicted dithiol-disulfide oxidoreductase (DUF899 family)
MAHEMIHGTFRQTNLPNESDEYLSKREELRLAEIELMRQRERVAELRRGLPQGTAVQDYAFEEGPAKLDAGDTPIRTVRLSELFSAPNRTLVVYHFMFGKKKTTPCPMCTLWIDGWNGVAHHLAQNVDVAIVAVPIRSRWSTRAHARLAQAEAPELWRQYVQIRSRERRPRGESGLDRFGLHSEQ